MLPTANGAVVTLLGLMSAGRVPAMINFTSGAANILAACRAAELDTIVTSRAFVEKAGSAILLPSWRRRSDRLSRRHPRDRHVRRQAPRSAAGEKAAGGAQAGRLGRHSVHVGLGGRAEGRRALPSQHDGERRAGRSAHRFRPRGQTVQRAAGVPLVRADRGASCCRSSRACRSISIRRRCTTAPCRSWSTACAPPSCSAPTRSSTAMRGWRTRMISARCATSSPAPSR